MMYNKDYILKEFEKSEQFASDQKYILDYCLRIRGKKNKTEMKDGKQISDVNGGQY